QRRRNGHPQPSHRRLPRYRALAVKLASPQTTQARDTTGNAPNIGPLSRSPLGRVRRLDWVVERIKHKLATTMMVRTRDNDAVGHATGQQRLSSKGAEIRAGSASLRPTGTRKVAENSAPCPQWCSRPGGDGLGGRAERREQRPRRYSRRRW